MAKKTTKEPDSKDLFTPLKKKLKALGFDYELPLTASAPGEQACVVWARPKGNETPRIFLLLVASDQWDKVNANWVETRLFELLPTEIPENEYPKFAYVSDGDAKESVFDLEYPAHQIDLLPTIDVISDYRQLKRDPLRRWSLKQYDRLMKGFNAFHEQVYQTVKDRVNGKNDIIEETAKTLFLESFRLQHTTATKTFNHDSKKILLDDVFNAEYVKKHGAKAVEQIHAAFEAFKSHPDYVVTDDKGEKHSIFDKNTHLRLEQPRNYITLLELIQNLGPVLDNNGREVKKNGTMLDISGDALGRAFDVFLRGNFESKGGFAIYLTPDPVKEAIMEMAFHDIKKETPEILTAERNGKVDFRAGDITCGSGGFEVKLLAHYERALEDMPMPDEKRERLKKSFREHGLVGADAAPMMVTLARLNLALRGAPRAQVFYTENSLTTDRLKPNSFDLLTINPPFGTPKFGKGQADAKARYEEEMEKILFDFRTDLIPTGKHKDAYIRAGWSWYKAGIKPLFDYSPTIGGMAMGGKPDSKGRWVTVGGTSIDPAVLFIDRCLQLLKPGGRLFIVLPDGILCNSGERYVREYIMGKKDEETGQFLGGKAIVKAVISLPSDTFKLSGTGAKTSVLYLQKRKARKDDPTKFAEEPQGDVFMAVADTLGYEVKNNVEDYSKGLPNDLAVITGSYTRGK